MKANIYRMPRDPGYLGGYYLTPTIVGFLGLLLTNAAATQYIAYHFEYQRALGEPLFRFSWATLYEPFAWASWVWHYGQSPEHAIRAPLLLAAFLVVIGVFASGGVFFALNLRHTKALSKDTEDLHGSAHWATEEDIRKTGLLDANQGVYIGGWYDDENRHLQYLRHNGGEHVLAFAPTRQGKVVDLVIPTLLAWSESAIIYDVKGENWSKTAGFRSQVGHICLGLCAVILSDIPTIITRPFSQCPISGLIASGGRLDRRPRHAPLARENIPHISHLTGSTPPPGPDVIPNVYL